jgi:chemotaxis protein MotD
MTVIDISAATAGGPAKFMGEAGGRTAGTGSDCLTDFADLLRGLAAPGSQAPQAQSVQPVERRSVWPDSRVARQEEDAADGLGLDSSPDTQARDVQAPSPDAAAPLPPVSPHLAQAALPALGSMSAGLLAAASVAWQASSALGPPEAAPAAVGQSPSTMTPDTTSADVLARQTAPSVEAAADDAPAPNAGPPLDRVAATERSVESAETGEPRLVVLGREAHITQLRAPAPAQDSNAGRIPPPGTHPPQQGRGPAAPAAISRSGDQPGVVRNAQLPGLPADSSASEAAGRGGQPTPPLPVPGAQDRDQAASNGGDSGESRQARAGETWATDPAATTASDGPHAAGTMPGPTQQVAGRIVSAVLAAQQDPRPADARSAIDPAMTNAASAPVVKVLRLQLQPADLGTITIRVSLREDALDIRLEASRRGTADMLQRDQEALARLLSSAGCRLDGMVVTVGGADGGQFTDGRAAAPQPAAGADQWGASQSDSNGRSSSGRHNAPADPGFSHGRQHEDSDKGSAHGGAGSGLYL